MSIPETNKTSVPTPQAAQPSWNTAPPPRPVPGTHPPSFPISSGLPTPADAPSPIFSAPPLYASPDVSEVTSDESVRYDLAGNPLPPLPKAEVPEVHFAPAPGGFTPPPGYLAPSSAVPRVHSTSASGPTGSMLYLSLGVGLLLLIGLIFGVRALKPKMVTAPTSYKTYSAIDSSFSCDQPGGWTMHETGATNGNLSTATFEDGHARVRVISDATGSLIADTMGAGNANLPPEQQIPPVAKLHTMDQKQLSSTMTDYKERDAQKFQSAAGDARVSEWTAAGGFGTGRLHGYRVTMLGREREFTLICFCPDKNWAVLMPAFQHIIASVKSGNPS